MFHEIDPDRAVRVVGGGELCGGDDPGIGLGGKMRLEPIGAGLCVDGRDDPVLGDLLRDAPGAFLLTGLDVLAGDESEQADVVVRLFAERNALGRPKDSQSVVHKSCHKGVAGTLVGPLDDRLATFVARCLKGNEGCLAH